MTQHGTPEIDVLVVGAGPVGLMMAGELARRGLTCRLIDQIAAPDDKSKALAIHSRTLEIFAHIGVLDEALAAGVRIHGNNVYADGRRLVHLTFDELDAPYPFVLDVPQCDTEAILARRAARLGVVTERPLRLIGLAPGPDQVTATLQSPDDAEHHVSARWLIGCDGAHSAVRHALGLPFEGSAYEDVWMAADVEIAWDLPDDEFHAFLAPEGALTSFPLPGAHRVRLIYDRPGRPGDSMVAKAQLDPPTLEEVQAEARRRSGKQVTLRDPRWLTGFRIHRRIVSSYRAGRVFLAGDAAHIHSPVGGQGMNMGLQDAFNLAWKLALARRGKAGPGLLDSYNAERRPIAAATLRGTDLATGVVTLRHPAARWARDHLAELLSGIEVVQARMLRSASQLAVDYRDSPIVGEHRGSVLRALAPASAGESPNLRGFLDFSSGPRPGDRAPELRGAAPLGLGHTLLLFDGPMASDGGYRGLLDIAAQAAAQVACANGGAPLIEARLILARADRPADLDWDGAVVLDESRRLHRAYGASSECLYLIRPDGYVGFRSQPADSAALAAHLSLIFGPR